MDALELTETVLSLYQDNKWREILDLNKDSKSIPARSLSWVWPSESNVDFIAKSVKNHQCSGVTSIGCGCGLLEWILHQSTGVLVEGYEINEEWWKSKYSNPQFIHLNYATDENLNAALDKNKALMFCYFNDQKAFLNYVRNYTGNLIIIIGPGEGRGTHTAPSPFFPNFGDESWTLCKAQEVKNTKDFIAIYARTSRYD